MGKYVALREIFSEYEWDESVGGGTVEHLSIDRDNRRAAVKVSFLDYVAASLLEKAARGAARCYFLRELAITPRFPEKSLEKMDFSELSDLLIREYSPAAGTLAGCQWSLKGDKLTLQLRANGRDALEREMPKVQSYLMERFGRRVEVEIQAGHELNGEALYEELARLRQEAIAAVPEPVFRDRGERGGQPKPSESAILGRPFKGEPTPMRELNLDMHKVIVEGEVFAVNHRELKKRNAWVICFDITDYTGSVRINQFMEANQARPVLDTVKKPGLWAENSGENQL